MVHFPRGPVSRYAPFLPHLWSDDFGIEGAAAVDGNLGCVILVSPVIDPLGLLV